MSQPPVKVAVIVGSTRRGRFGPVVANWYASEVSSRDDIALDMVDLADARLPETVGDYDEEPDEAAVALAPRLAAADAFVVVTPEYNHSYPASLKTAIDAFMDEWKAKPIALISYGGMAGGVRAAEHLRQVFPEVHAMTIRDTVSFHNYPDLFDEAGRPVDGEGCAGAAKTMTDQLLWWARALRVARTTDPYE